jgi:transcriptional regulator with PAS, ATPase and Fis domain
MAIVKQQTTGADALALIKGKSKHIREVKVLIKKLAQYPRVPVLITGETGTGKELVANALHACSTRSEKPLIRVNCSAIPDNLLESTLFGHKKGAFTGAEHDRKGLVEEAHTGTLFLDEIGEMNPVFQPKLLRFLENMTFRRVGQNKERRIDTWIISATNKDLDKLSTNRLFRQDLLYRLKGTEICLKMLKQRKEDILLLAHYFLTCSFDEKYGNKKTIFSRDVEELLINYPWPGNIRELKRLMEQVAVVAENQQIHLCDFPDYLKHRMNSICDRFKPLKQIEKEYIKNVLSLNDFKIRQTAKVLGIDRNTLRKKIQDLSISIDSKTR